MKLKNSEHHFNIYKNCYRLLETPNKIKTEGEILFDQTNVFQTAAKTDQVKLVPEKVSQIGNRPQKILICAPSNCAIDQIMRLLV